MPNTEVTDSTTTNVEIKIDLLANMIPRFDGKNNFYDFIDNCDLAHSLTLTNQRTVLLTIIKSKIIANARAMIRNREFESWDDLRSHLVETYSEKRSHSQWQLELSLCKQSQHETVTQYSHKVENCLVRLTNSLDTTLNTTERKANVKLLRTQALNIFITGLNKDLHLIVKAQKPQTLEDAISIAQSEEKEQRARRDLERHQSYRPTTNKHHYINTTQVKPSTSYTPQHHFKQCRYCKKMGHTIEECRKRQYNNEKRQTLNQTKTHPKNA